MNTKKYTALTIDTSIFDQNALKLKKGALATLKQFKDLPINFILSDIVEREVIKHLNKKEMEVIEKIKSATKDDDLSNYLGCDDRFLLHKNKLLNIHNQDDMFTNNLWRDFINDCDVNIIESEGNVSIDELINLYFSCKAPFSESGKKKNEFPDAIALLAFKKWAVDNNQMILAVSDDKDWKKFAENEDWIDVVDDLGTAIETLRSICDNSLQDLVIDIQNNLFKEPYSLFLENIKEEIESKLYISEIYAESPFQYEIDDEMIQVNEIIEISNIRLIDSDLESVTIMIDCKVDYYAEASFCFFVKDSIDKDDVNLGSSHKSIEDLFSTEIVITLTGNIINGLESMDINEIEITHTDVAIDMGYVHPFEDYDEGNY